MDGAFLEQNAEAIDGEVDEYYRELFKIQKIFNQKVKKMQVEQEEKERERKKKRRLAEEDGKSPPPESDEEDAMKIPEAVNIINSTMDGIKDFKVIFYFTAMFKSCAGFPCLNPVLDSLV
ncbi:dynein heavy chain 7, axonemal [Elysia marginata]|uniref:Dynein heavy chain 7, axonemal n=1 Tax=Elysia marginata TaxID=1093978 RepID=A0AAV4HXM6_9GAST|nr:dynein heavy chain 7, axonemal [Elysia marginata]